MLHLNDPYTWWECKVCGANMGGCYEFTYPGDTDPTTLCADCMEAVDPSPEGQDRRMI